MEGYLLRKTRKKSKLKKEWFNLLRKELYYYRSKKENQYKNLYILIGVYISREQEELFQNERKLFPFSLAFPHKHRPFYLIKKARRDKWVRVLKEVVGYVDFFDYYESNEIVGKGKFGAVKKLNTKKKGNNQNIKKGRNVQQRS